MSKKRNKQIHIKWGEFFNIYKGLKLPWLIFGIMIFFGFAYGWAVVKQAGLEQGFMSGGVLTTDVIVQYLIISLASMLIMFMQQYVRDGLCVEHINREMRKKLWGNLIRMPIKYYDKETPEALVSRITRDCEKANSLIVEIVGWIAQLATLVMALSALFGYSNKLLMLTGLAIIAVVIYGLAISKVSYWANYMMQTYMSPFTMYLAQRLKAFELIKASGTEDEEFERGQRVINDMYKADIASRIELGVIATYVNLTSIANTVIVYIGGSIMMAKGILDAGVLVAYYSLASTAMNEIMMYFQAYVNIKGSQGGLAKVVRIIDAESEDVDSGEHIDIPDDDIAFEGVDFAYPDGANVLNNVSFTIPKGKTTAIVGSNGEGKTTVLKLLERYYDPGEGRVMFGGRNANEFSKREWRQMFGYTSQDSQILSGTVRDNITYGLKRYVSEEELDSIAEKANLKDLIHSLPDGYDTFIDDGGSNFSSGELQRLNIARTIAKNPEYMLLDESTCNLDPDTEIEVQGALEKMMKGRTIVIIAHSYNAIKGADNVIVLEGGTVTCQGTQKEVEERNGFFREFVDSSAI